MCVYGGGCYEVCLYVNIIYVFLLYYICISIKVFDCFDILCNYRPCNQRDQVLRGHRMSGTKAFCFRDRVKPICQKTHALSYFEGQE